MSVSPRDLLLEARKLAERADAETARRSAITRAYYAAYHGAKGFHNRLPLPGRSIPKGGEHENLIHQLRHPDTKLDPELSKLSLVIGMLLLQLRPLRIRAEYELQAEIAFAEMGDALEMAARILNLADPK